MSGVQRLIATGQLASNFPIASGVCRLPEIADLAILAGISPGNLG